MTIALSIERPAAPVGNPPATGPGYLPVPSSPAANDPAAVRSDIASRVDVALPPFPLHAVRYDTAADGIVAKALGAAVASVGALALLEAVARLAMLQA
jgi:hypothetical protein